LHRTIKKVGEDTEKRHYNTAIAAMMEFTNAVNEGSGTLSPQALKSFLLVLAPFAPHLAEELYQQLEKGSELRGNSSVHAQLWPTFEEKNLVDEVVPLIVQVNGKFRDSVTIDAQKSTIQGESEAAAKASEKVQKFINGAEIKKVIFIPGKLINFLI
jgi:leucyl-tRNA synthetase